MSHLSRSSAETYQFLDCEKRVCLSCRGRQLRHTSFWFARKGYVSQLTIWEQERGTLCTSTCCCIEMFGCSVQNNPAQPSQTTMFHFTSAYFMMGSDHNRKSKKPKAQGLQGLKECMVAFDIGCTVVQERSTLCTSTCCCIEMLEAQGFANP